MTSGAVVAVLLDPLVFHRHVLGTPATHDTHLPLKRKLRKWEKDSGSGGRVESADVFALGNDGYVVISRGYRHYHDHGFVIRKQKDGTFKVTRMPYNRHVIDQHPCDPEVFIIGEHVDRKDDADYIDYVKIMTVRIHSDNQPVEILQQGTFRDPNHGYADPNLKMPGWFPFTVEDIYLSEREGEEQDLILTWEEDSLADAHDQIKGEERLIIVPGEDKPEPGQMSWLQEREGLRLEAKVPVWTPTGSWFPTGLERGTIDNRFAQYYCTPYGWYVSARNERYHQNAFHQPVYMGFAKDEKKATTAVPYQMQNGSTAVVVRPTNAAMGVLGIYLSDTVLIRSSRRDKYQVRQVQATNGRASEQLSEHFESVGHQNRNYRKGTLFLDEIDVLRRPPTKVRMMLTDVMGADLAGFVMGFYLPTMF